MHVTQNPIKCPSCSSCPSCSTTSGLPRCQTGGRSSTCAAVAPIHSTPWQLQSTTRHGPSHPPNHHPHSHPTPHTYSKRLLEVHSTATHEQMIGRARGRWVFVDPGAKPGTAAAAPRQRARRTLTGSATLEALPGWDPAFDVPMALQHNKNNNSQILGLATGPHLDAWKVMALRTTNQVTRSMCMCMCMCARRGTQCTQSSTTPPSPYPPSPHMPRAGRHAMYARDAHCTLQVLTNVQCPPSKYADVQWLRVMETSHTGLLRNGAMRLLQVSGNREAQSLGCRSRVVGWLWSSPPYYVHVLVHVLVHVHVHVPMCTRRQEWQADGATKRQKEALSELLHNLQADILIVSASYRRCRCRYEY